MLKLAAVFYLGLVLVALGLNWLRGVALIPLAFTPRLWPALGASALMTLATLVFSWFAARRFPWAQQLETFFRQVIGPLPTRDVLLIALLSGTVEEIFFRGALQPALVHAFGSKALGLLVTTAGFAVIHTGRSAALRAWMPFAFVLGLFLGAVTLACDNILPAMLCHVTVNAVNLHRIARPLEKRSSQ